MTNVLFSFLPLLFVVTALRRCSMSPGCCEDDCCGPGTSWSGISGCRLNSTSSGWNGPQSNSANYKVGCVEGACCEEKCCGRGTVYDDIAAFCRPDSPITGTASFPDMTPSLTIGTTAPSVKPFISPTPPTSPYFPVCDICGTGLFISRPDAILTNVPGTGMGPISCHDLDIHGLIGYIDPALCPALPFFVGSCGCQVRAPPVASPNSRPTALTAPISPVWHSPSQNSPIPLLPTPPSPLQSQPLSPDRVLRNKIEHLIETSTLTNANDFTDPARSYALTITAMTAATNNYTRSELLQRYALGVLYFATTPNNWYHKYGWDKLDFPCRESVWFGIECEDKDVVSIKLFSNNMKGTIPSELRALTALKTLTLYINDLTGTIPASIGQLDSLNSLELGFNALTGTIPCHLGQLTALTSLVLANNRLQGMIPTELGQVSFLEEIFLISNRLTGTIPSELGSLIHLRYADFSQNLLSGQLPIQWCNSESSGAFGVVLGADCDLVECPCCQWCSWSSTATAPIPMPTLITPPSLSTPESTFLPTFGRSNLPLVLSAEFPSCPICGEGQDVQFPEVTIAFPGAVVSCGFLDLAGQDGFIDPDFCSELTVVVVNYCGCIDSTRKPTAPPSPPFQSPFESPIKSPIEMLPPALNLFGLISSRFLPSYTTPSPSQPVASSPAHQDPIPPNPGFPSCSACGTGKEVSLPLGTVTIDLSQFSCGYIQLVGQLGYISPEWCAFVQSLMEDCGCMDVAPLSDVGQPSLVSSPIGPPGYPPN